MGCKQVTEGKKTTGGHHAVSGGVTIGSPPIDAAGVKSTPPQAVPVNIIVKKKDGTKLLEKNYTSRDLLCTVEEDFKSNLPEGDKGRNFAYKTSTNKPITAREVEISTIMAEGTPNGPVPTITIEVEMIGLMNLPKESDRTFSNSVFFLGKPLIEPFEIAIFDRATKKIKTEEFDQQTLASTEIHHYSELSAYCNWNNCLYISGGENPEGDALKNFWIVDLSKKEIKKHATGMKNGKKSHSMIYVPNSFVFITGGNTKETVYYDTTDGKFKEWGPLNENRIEPALAVINNHLLFAFTGVSYGKNQKPHTFERTNIRDSNNWELLEPKLTPGVDFTQKFFAVSPHKQDKVIFLGGNNEGKDGKDGSHCFEYNYLTNDLKTSNVQYEPIDLAEKSFYPLNEHNNFLIPNFQKRNLSILTYTSSNEVLKRFSYEPDVDTVPSSKKMGANGEMNVPGKTHADLNMQVAPLFSIPKEKIEVTPFPIVKKIEEGSRGPKFFPTEKKVSLPDATGKIEEKLNTPDFIHENVKSGFYTPIGGMNVDVKTDNNVNLDPNAKITTNVKVPEMNVDPNAKFNANVKMPEAHFDPNAKFNANVKVPEMNGDPNAKFTSNVKVPEMNVDPNAKFNANVKVPGMNVDPNAKITTNVKVPEMNVDPNAKFSSNVKVPEMNVDPNAKFNANVKVPEMNVDPNAKITSNVKVPEMNVDPNAKFSSNVKVPEMNVDPNAKFNANVKVPGMNVDPNAKFNANVKMPEAHVDPNAKFTSNVKVPEMNVDPNAKFTSNVKVPEMNVDPNAKFNANVKVPGMNVDPNAKFTSNVKVPEMNVDPNAKFTSNVKVPEMNVDPNAKFNANVKVPGMNVDPNAKITTNVKVPEMNVDPNAKITTNVKVPEMNVDPNAKFTSNVKVPEMNVDPNAKFNANVKVPEMNVDPNAKFNANVKMPEAHVDPNAKFSSNVKVPEMNVDPNAKFSSNVKVPEMNVDPNAKFNANVKVPEMNVDPNAKFNANVKVPEMNVDPNAKFNANVKVPEMNVDPNAKFNANVKVPGMNVDPNAKITTNVKVPEMNVDPNAKFTSNVKVPGMNVDPNANFSTNVKVPEMNVDPNAKFTSNVKVPGMNVDPNANVSTNVKVPGMNVDPNAKFTSNVKVPEMNVDPNANVSANVKVPEMNVDPNVKFTSNVKVPEMNVSSEPNKGNGVAIGTSYQPSVVPNTKLQKEIGLKPEIQYETEQKIPPVSLETKNEAQIKPSTTAGSVMKGSVMMTVGADLNKGVRKSGGAITTGVGGKKLTSSLTITK